MAEGTLIFDALNKSIQLFPVDLHRNDPFLLKIWLAYLEAHLYELLHQWPTKMIVVRVTRTRMSAGGCSST